MSDPTTTAGESLSFEKADYQQLPPPPGCIACGLPIEASYYTVNGALLCPGCHEKGTQPQGGNGAAFLKAALLGVGAAIIGSIVWIAVRNFTDAEWGIVAIGVGLLVGAAVRHGSGRRGGWLYQGLAVVLTYLSIVSTYIPPIVEAMRQQAAKESGAAAPAGGDTAAPADVAERGDPAAATQADAAAGTPADEAPSAGAVAASFAVLLAFACAAPFLMGFKNIIGLIIIGIALYQAWSMNKREPLVIAGPFTVGRQPAA